MAVVAHALSRNIPAQKKDRLLVRAVGQYGIFSGKRWRATIYPRVRGFIRSNA